MKIWKIILLLITSLCAFSAKAQNIQTFDQKVNAIFSSHFNKYKNLEYFSGASLSISLPKQEIKNYFIGNVSHEKNSKKISASPLFPIGSITKSFTAAVILQLETEHKLNIDDKLQNWLSAYPQWSTLSIKSLLNMTSGLPNYSDTPQWNVAATNTPEKIWTNQQLIDFVYPKSTLSPPLKSGYFYTNTGYVLTDLIIEKATGKTFKVELINRTIKRAELQNTFYPIPTAEKELISRLAQGYNFNQYDNPEIVGKSVSNNLSWAAAAGGLIANSEDIIKWVKTLFVENKILEPIQKEKMMELVSIKSGEPIQKLSAKDPRGFGLGIAKSLDPETFVDNFWFYEGETLGFRALYMYVPCNGIIISTIFNSATNNENDHTSELMKQIYKLIMTEYIELNCKNTQFG